MKRWGWLVLGVGLCAAAYLSGRLGLASWFRAPASSGPVLEVDRVVDLGRQETDLVVEATFPLHNRGDSPLHISRVQTNCNCQGVFLLDAGRRIKVESFVVAPGDTAELRMPFVVQGHPGVPNRRFVRFETNDPAHPSVQVDGVIIPLPMCIADPPSLFLANAVTGRSVSHAIELRATDRNPAWAIDRVSASNPELVQVQLSPPGRDRGSEGRAATGPLVGRLNVTVVPQQLGELDGEIAVFSAGREKPLVRIPVKVVAVSAIELSPSELRLPRQSSSGPVYQARCLCRAAEQTPLTVLVVEAPPEIAVEVTDVPGTPSIKAVAVNCEGVKNRALSAPAKYQIRLKATQADSAYPLTLTVVVNSPP